MNSKIISLDFLSPTQLFKSQIKTKTTKKQMLYPYLLSSDKGNIYQLYICHKSSFGNKKHQSNHKQNFLLKLY